MGNIFKIIFYVLVVGALIFGIGYYIWGDNDPNKGSSISLIVTYILLGIAAFITLSASIANMIQHPKSSVKSLIGVAGVVLIAIIGYNISKGEVLDAYLDFGVSEPGQSKMIDAGLYLLYGILGISFVGILVSEFTGLFKN